MLDRAAKLLAMSYLAPVPGGAGREFLSMGLYYNSGISFSLLSGLGNLGLVSAVIGIAALSALCVRVKEIREMWGVPLLYAGAVGNLSDRLIFGRVLDWIYVGLHINLADVWLALGCALIIVQLARDSYLSNNTNNGAQR
jgi:signal peptidase II